MKLKIFSPPIIISIIILILVGGYLGAVAYFNKQNNIGRIELPMLPTVGVEATVLRLSKNSLAELKCDPVCNETFHDSGKIRIDKIYDRTNDPRNIDKTQVGDEIDVTFDYSAQPAKVLRDPELDSNQPQSKDKNQVVSYAIKPVQYQNGHFIYFLSISKSNEVTLPGLKVGEHIKISGFSSSLRYIGQYEVINQQTTTKTKEWYSFDSIQCLGNPWEQWWIASHNNDYNGYPKDEEKQIIQEYLESKGYSVYDVKIELKHQEVCSACNCPRGDEVSVLVDKNKISKIRENQILKSAVE